MELKFNDKGLLPVITQDYLTREVLMFAYMNKEAYDKTIETGKVHYYSRSRETLWLKGETSGHFQIVKDIRVDCDNDTLLILIEQCGGACHTGKKSCFYRNLKGEEVRNDTNINDIFNNIYDVIVDRRENPVEGAYTNYLLIKGIDKILKKVGEESAEVIIAAKNQDKNELTCEVSDLMYHLSVMMVVNEITWEDVSNELKKRR